MLYTGEAVQVLNGIGLGLAGRAPYCVPSSAIMVLRPYQSKTRSWGMVSFHGDLRNQQQSSTKITGGVIWAIIVGTLVLHSLVHVQDDYNYKMMQPAEQSKVLIIGAGAAGLTAAATLVDCKVEDIRSNDIGGRIKKS
eukprot:scaffold388_cov114-Cylindrotheca_fusiformis.AAC.27